MNDTISRLKKTAEAVEPRLESLLITPDPRLEKLYEAMRYSALSGGKRIRPHLVFEFCRLFGGSDGAALDFACAIELVHASSLVHDDMPCMDNDDYRRGKLTCHKVFGEDIALLCGDALITKGYETAAKNAAVPEHFALEGAKLITELAGGVGMMGGQNVDLLSDGKSIDFDTLIYMHSLKTGALIRASALLGALAAGIELSDERAADAEKYAGGVGLAFQIIDDILDRIGDEKELGKATHADEKEHKTTFLSFMPVSKARIYASEQTEAAIRSIEKYGGSDHLVEFARALAERQR